MIPCWGAAILFLAPCREPQGEWVTEPECLDAVVEFLGARSDALHLEVPETFEWSEWDENSIGLVHWSGVHYAGMLYADCTIYAGHVTRAAAETGAAGHRATLIHSGGRWLLVERPIPDVSQRPWFGVLSSSCPTPQWLSTMLHRWRKPLYGQTVREYIATHPPVRMRQGEDSIEVDLAATAEVAEHLALGRIDWVTGFLGVSVVFTRASGWFPVLLRELHALDSVGEQDASDLEHASFGGFDALVFHTDRWSHWVELGEAMVPTRLESEFAVRVDVDGLVVQRTVVHSELEASVLDGPPQGISFSLVAPDWMGPVGSISNTDTGEVRLFDSRPPADRRDSREQFVDLVTDSAGPTASAAKGRGRGLLGTFLMASGSALLGWAAWHALTAWRRRRA